MLLAEALPLIIANTSLLDSYAAARSVILLKLYARQMLLIFRAYDTPLTPCCHAIARQDAYITKHDIALRYFSRDYCCLDA